MIKTKLKQTLFLIVLIATFFSIFRYIFKEIKKDSPKISLRKRFFQTFKITLIYTFVILSLSSRGMIQNSEKIYHLDESSSSIVQIEDMRAGDLSRKFGPFARGMEAARKAAGMKRGSKFFVDGFSQPPPSRGGKPPPGRTNPKFGGPNNVVRGQGGDDGGGGGGPETDPRYFGGPNPYKKFDFDKSDHRREISFDKSQLAHFFDQRAKEALGITGNKNKVNMEVAANKIQDYVGTSTNPLARKIRGSWRYENAAYIFKQKKSNLVVITDTDLNFISAFNATDYQLDQLKRTKNIGLDTRPRRPSTNYTKTSKSQGEF